MPWLMAKLYDRMMAGTEEACLRDWRRELLSEAKGEVLEIGAGTGANLTHYPSSVTRLCLAEPDPHMRSQLEHKVAAGPRKVEVVDAGAERLPFPDASFDTVVGTLVLCSVQDPAAAIAELYRVLRPGGQLIFLEHVAAQDNPGRLRWQRRFEPLWKRIAGNCHLTRETGAALRRAGFELLREEHASMRKAPPIVRPTIRGLARKAS
jgi:ubiquinone/menaquinone biosynthesis C-methylase UbiE